MTSSRAREDSAKTFPKYTTAPSGTCKCTFGRKGSFTIIIHEFAHFHCLYADKIQNVIHRIFGKILCYRFAANCLLFTVGDLQYSVNKFYDTHVRRPWSDHLEKSCKHQQQNHWTMTPSTIVDEWWIILTLVMLLVIQYWLTLCVYILEIECALWPCSVLVFQRASRRWNLWHVCLYTACVILKEGVKYTKYIKTHTYTYTYI